MFHLKLEQNEVGSFTKVSILGSSHNNSSRIRCAWPLDASRSWGDDTNPADQKASVGEPLSCSRSRMVLNAHQVQNLGNSAASNGDRTKSLFPDFSAQFFLDVSPSLSRELRAIQTVFSRTTRPTLALLSMQRWPKEALEPAQVYSCQGQWPSVQP